MQTYYPPTHGESSFHCIHCGIKAAQYWNELLHHSGSHSYSKVRGLDYNICSHCSKWSFWYLERMIIPCEAPVPPAHPDLPASCLAEYNEARSIVALSPRAAAALLRLALQKLLIEIGEKGKRIDDDIGSLVAKGLPIEVQQALDYCRVVGNNAVHPGEIDLNDTPEIAHHIFAMLNFIVVDRIARPKQIATLYAKLPEGARKAVENRDGSKS